MKNVRFIAWQDVRQQLRQGATLMWVFVMPPVFFYFIGTVTGGFSSGFAGDPTPLRVVADTPGFLEDQIDLRLRENDFAPEWAGAGEPIVGDAPTRTLVFDSELTESVLAGEIVAVTFETDTGALTRDFEEIRIQRSLYTVVADIATAGIAQPDGLSADALRELNAVPRPWQLDVSPAGKRREIPSGFQQSVPGILVMFTLLVLLNTGATMLVTEREQGLLRRLASAPMSRGEVVAGKWSARMVLAAVQVTVALLFGTYVFDMQWGPDFGMVVLILVGWAGFCASAALWLGSVANSVAQASGLGVLAANALAALGGCWWPIEVTPEWMQALQKFLPTGWTMDALHKLISFQAGAAAAVPNLLILLLTSAVVGWLAVRRFRYQ